MKKIFAFLSMIFVYSAVFPQAQDGFVDYQNKQVPAAILELPYPPSIVNEAMNQFLLKKGRSRVDNIRGFSTFRNTQQVSSDSTNADLYYKIERKSRREKEITIISLLLKPELNDSATNKHYMSMDAAKSQLNELAVAIEAYNLEVSINDRNADLIKAEKKWEALIKDGEDLEKKRTALDKRIADNKIEQQVQLREVENQKQKLSTQVDKRKS